MTSDNKPYPDTISGGLHFYWDFIIGILRRQG
jgi:hypothetical protein